MFLSAFIIEKKMEFTSDSENEQNFDKKMKHKKMQEEECFKV